MRTPTHRHQQRHRRSMGLRRSMTLLIATTFVVAGCSSAAASDDVEVSHAQTYADCMREKGIESFPDPVNVDGELVSQLPQTFDLESPEFVAAETACNLALTAAETSSPGDDQQAAEELEAAFEFAACMRSQGINFPDPVVEENGFSGPAGPLDDDIEGFEAANEICGDTIDVTPSP